MKTSLVITIFNEESTLDSLFQSLKKQTVSPNEIIIVDGGSTDSSIAILSEWKKDPFFKNRLLVLEKKGNRSIGRNAGIHKAKHDWIAITDAGCTPDQNWLKELISQQKEKNTDVVAGYAYGIATTPFEKAVLPYVLVMPDRVNPDDFLPATRSMLMKKTVWEKLGGFDENLSHNEDYAFAQKIKAENISRSFTQKAQVGWFPRKNLFSFASMIYRFAYGDAEANILRPKVLFLFARYTLLFFLGFTWYLSFFQEKLFFLQTCGIFFFALLFFVYGVWSIQKNKKYVGNGWYWLPMLQLTADAMVLMGTLQGTFASQKNSPKEL